MDVRGQVGYRGAFREWPPIFMGPPVVSGRKRI